MHRLVSFGQAAVAAACLLALGCATPPVASSPISLDLVSTAAPETAAVRTCEALEARIHDSEARYAARAGTWLDAPNRMVESRRLHVLQGRADDLGCGASPI